MTPSLEEQHVGRHDEAPYAHYRRQPFTNPGCLVEHTQCALLIGLNPSNARFQVCTSAYEQQNQGQQAAEVEHGTLHWTSSGCACAAATCM